MVEVFSVQDGLDAERALLDEVCGGAREHGLLLWQPCDRALVMPRRMERLEGFAPASAAVAERGWPVLLRDTGGEPVPQSPGVLNIALSYALGARRQRADPYRNRLPAAVPADLRLAPRARAWTPAWAPWPVPSATAANNVTLDGRKLAGTAQRWRRNGAGRPVVLAHAALLVGAEREEMVEVVNTFTRRCASARIARRTAISA
ncbi:putative lipoate-protein ligase [Pseudomonas aeruginosa]|nr:putative lipoate-protein ligase [Pseudomonas aeruginosa]